MRTEELDLSNGSEVARLRRRERSDGHRSSERRLACSATDSDSFRVAGTDPDDDRLAPSDDEDFDPVVDVRRFRLGGVVEAPDERLLDDGAAVGGDYPSEIPTCGGTTLEICADS